MWPPEFRVLDEHVAEWKRQDTEWANRLWQELGDIPVNDDGRLQEWFLHFPPSTHREDVWHWFEREFGLSVRDLMFPTEEA